MCTLPLRKPYSVSFNGISSFFRLLVFSIFVSLLLYSLVIIRLFQLLHYYYLYYIFLGNVVWKVIFCFVIVVWMFLKPVLVFFSYFLSKVQIFLIFSVTSFIYILHILLSSSLLFCIYFSINPSYLRLFCITVVYHLVVVYMFLWFLFHSFLASFLECYFCIYSISFSLVVASYFCIYSYFNIVYSLLIFRKSSQ